MVYKSDEQLWDICMDIYRELYKKSEPSTDFDRLIDSGETSKENWFNNYYMDQNEQSEIIEKHCKKNKLNEFQCKKIRFNILLGSAPSCCNKEDK